MVLEGIGSYGLVLSSPRIPLVDEDIEEISKLNEVSKILFSTDEINDRVLPTTPEDIKQEYLDVEQIILKYPTLFNNNNFILPIRGGTIDKQKFVENYEKENYFGFGWLSKNEDAFNILNNLLKYKINMFQIIYERGEKINLQPNDFICKMSLILECLENLNQNGFFLDDIKFDNLLVHDGRIKFIDFSSSINLNTTFENIKKQLIDSKFNTIFYFPYSTLDCIMLFETINKTNRIGQVPLNFDGSKQFSKLLSKCLEEYENFVFHRNRMVQNLYFFLKKYVGDIKIELEVVSQQNLHNISNYEDYEKFLEKKTIGLGEFLNSLTMLLVCSSLYYQEYIKANANFGNCLKLCVSRFSNELIDISINSYIDLIKKIFPNDIDKMHFHLKSMNIYSFGYVFMDWLNRNSKYFLGEYKSSSKIFRFENQTDELDEKIEKHKKSMVKYAVKLFNIISCSCLNIVIDSNNLIYYHLPKYDNLKKNFY